MWPGSFLLAPKYPDGICESPPPPSSLLLGRRPGQGGGSGEALLPVGFLVLGLPLCYTRNHTKGLRLPAWELLCPSCWCPHGYPGPSPREKRRIQGLGLGVPQTRIHMGLCSSLPALWLSESPFPHLQNGDNRTFLTRQL